MSIRVVALEDANAADYERVLAEAPHSLLYSSLAYRAFLQKVLPDAKTHYLIAYDDDRPVGVLPTVVQNNLRHGAVLNSLPFYGSNGGVTVGSSARNVGAIYGALLDAVDEVMEASDIAASTIISNPLDGKDDEQYAARKAHTFRDERIGQITPLPDGADEMRAAVDLMDSFHTKTRNAIRKAQKSGLNVAHAEAPGAMETLAELHRENIAAVAGLAKPREVFQAISDSFTYDRDYRIYTATLDGATIAALLVFFHHRTAEYYTPTTNERFRSLQPMSLLVFKAMQEAAARGCTNWNWGGTWLSQQGVYRFKSRWGTVDRPYHYYTRLRNSALLRLTRAELLREYRFFYVVPFEELSAAVEVEHAQR